MSDDTHTGGMAMGDRYVEWNELSADERRLVRQIIEAENEDDD